MPLYEGSESKVVGISGVTEGVRANRETSELLVLLRALVLGLSILTGVDLLNEDS